MTNVIYKVQLAGVPGFGTDPNSVLRGINDAGVAVGNGSVGAFVYNINGAATTISFPGSNETEAKGINSAGTIVGWYVDANNVQHGFFDSGGSYVTLDDPHGTDTTPAAVNGNGFVVGSVFDAGHFQGFVWTAQLGFLEVGNSSGDTATFLKASTTSTWTTLWWWDFQYPAEERIMD